MTMLADRTPFYVRRYIGTRLAKLANMVSVLFESCAGTTPSLPLPRQRRFLFAPCVVWPGNTYDSIILPDSSRPLSPHTLDEIASTIVHQCGGKTRRALWAARQIDAATAWARKRHIGLARAKKVMSIQQANQIAIIMSEGMVREIGETAKL